jgi:AcrR family transcriptional regulator
MGMLYRRFGSKQALILDIVVDSFNEVQTERDAALADEDPARSLAACVTVLTRSPEKRPGRDLRLGATRLRLRSRPGTLTQLPDNTNPGSGPGQI